MADSVMPTRSRSSRRGAAARLRSAVSTVVRSVTVAAGVFAPGHLGELTRQVPFELVDAVLEQTRATEQRLRRLPSRVGVYFVLALALFPGVGSAKVWASMLAGLGAGLRVSVSDKALRDLRRRVGAAPVKALFETLAGPVAQPSTPGVRFGRYRTVAFDGCVSIKVPDTDRNRSWLGKLRAAHGVTGYPVVKLMTLVETGTRALLGAVFGPPATAETDYPRRLLGLLDRNMLVLLDRGFDAGEFLTELAGTGAQFLARIRSIRKLPVLARCDDGSYLSCIDALTVRVITADITVTCADGSSYTANYRLATTLIDPRRYPAGALIGLYHERWEHEIAYLALRHTLGEGRVAALHRPRRRAAGDLGVAHHLSGAAARHGHRGRIPSRHRPGPRQLRHRPAHRPRPAHPGRQHHRRRRPHRRHRPGRPRRPAPAPTAPHQRAQGQIPALALQQERPVPARTQHSDHRPERHHQRTGNERRDTRTEMLDNSTRTLTTRH